MNNNSYVVASVKKWHKYEFEKIKKKLSGNWYLLENYADLTLEKLEKINPSYIFFPHWSKKVSHDIFNKFECVCFHETDLPFGRGGSPIQNLIRNGFDKTKITALKMIDDLDAGPIYLKTNLSLEGLAEEIYLRSAKLIFEMIETIVLEEIKPKNQKGEVTRFKRRDPKQSLIPEKIDNLKELFDFIRMLDAEGYPSAKIIYSNFVFEFERPALRTEKIEASVKIKRFD